MPLIPTPLVVSPSPSRIHLRNLHTTLPCGKDAWGRPNRLQPLNISLTVGMSSPFTAAAAAQPTPHDDEEEGEDRGRKREPRRASGAGGSGRSDRLDSTTVHYGLLAKSILASLECYSSSASCVPAPPATVLPVPTATAGVTAPRPSGQHPPTTATTTRAVAAAAAAGAVAAGTGTGAASGVGEATTLSTVLVRIWSHLTGLSVDGRERNLPEDEHPFIPSTTLSSLSVTLTLPKATLLGTGVSLTATASFGPPAAAPGLVSDFAIQLAVRGLRVPVLVGVNKNERMAKQMVIADVEVENFDVEGDVYAEVEGVVVKAMEESSYETLEALAVDIAEKVMSFFPPNDHLTGRELGWQVRVSLEKPIAIPLADGPIVEVTVG